MSNCHNDWCRDEVMDYGLSLKIRAEQVAEDVMRLPLKELCYTRIAQIVRQSFLNEEVGVNIIREELIKTSRRSNDSTTT